ncbi:MAG: hypothetical protein AB8B64_26360 [Granulosicoccus sp.]
MNQLRFSDAEYAGKIRKTRREEFLEKMDTLIQLQSLKTLIPATGFGSSSSSASTSAVLSTLGSVAFLSTLRTR